MHAAETPALSHASIDQLVELSPRGQRMVGLARRGRLIESRIPMAERPDGAKAGSVSRNRHDSVAALKRNRRILGDDLI